MNFRSPEQICFRLHKKSDGAHRPIFIYGPQNIARQLILLDLLKASFALPRWQYDQKGHGRDAAVRDICRMIEAGCAEYVVADIADCFSSFDGGRIASILSLPEEIVSNDLIADNLNDVVYLGTPVDGHTCLQPRRPSGLPQGSVVSNFLASVLLSDLTELLPPDTMIFMYRDDIVTLSARKDRADETVFALEGGLKNHRSGRLRLKRCLRGNAREQPFDFLGYKITHEGGRVEVALSDYNEDRLWERWWGAAQSDAAALDGDVPCVRALLRQRLSGFQLADPTPIYDSLISAAEDLVWQERVTRGVPRIALETPAKRHPDRRVQKMKRQGR